MIPKTLGRFEIVNELGRGAMGVVYKGRDPKLERTVALKVIHFGLNKEDEQQLQVKERFLVEARATAQLQHSNILTIYDVGDEGNLTYIAMEFLEGGSLEDMIKGGKFNDYDQIIDIVRQIAEGLDHAHQKGIVHRDIKPANIMMAGGKVPKIADFGLARLSNSTLTTTGTVLGTPSYMAPEQIRGRKVDGRADLFALGVIFYEMLTGEKPFGGDSITSVIYRVVNEEPIPPRKLNIDLPTAIDQFMQKALNKEPGQRFQTGVEFADALRLLQKGLYKSEMAMPASSNATQRLTADETARLAAPQKKNMGLIIGGAVGAVAVIGLVAMLFAGGKKEETVKADAGGTAVEAPSEAEKPKEPAKPVEAKPKEDKAKAIRPEDARSKEAKLKQDKAKGVKPEETKPAEAALKVEKAKGGKPEESKPKEVASKEEKAKETKPKEVTSKEEKAKEIKPEAAKHKETKKEAKAREEKAAKEEKAKEEAAAQEAKEPAKEEKKAGGLAGLLGSGSCTLIVEAKEGDKVTVDGRNYTVFPVELKDISSGNHNIFVVRKGSKPFLKSISIKAGETIKITPEF